MNKQLLIFILRYLPHGFQSNTGEQVLAYTALGHSHAFSLTWLTRGCVVILYRIIPDIILEISLRCECICINLLIPHGDRHDVCSVTL